MRRRAKICTMVSLGSSAEKVITARQGKLLEPQRRERLGCGELRIEGESKTDRDGAGMEGETVETRDWEGVEMLDGGVGKRDEEGMDGRREAELCFGVDETAGRGETGETIDGEGSRRRKVAEWTV